MKKDLHLFEAYGIETEFMIVDAITLDIKPISDQLFKAVTGEFSGYFENEEIAWSNELVNHVIEIKTNGPTTDIKNVVSKIHENIRLINSDLEQLGARLMPGAMHPWMNPYNETQLWQHEFSDIYSLYHSIFNCQSHGWGNIQSTHLNLPFFGDAEFGRLHAAIRLILPLIPGIAAASPFMEGRLTGMQDSRIEAYRHNQSKIPILTGKIIPERIYTRADYQTQLFDKITEQIRNYDTEHILDKHFLNSRGAIARFDRGAIEIRLIDAQESPRADVAILTAVISVLKLLCLERWTPCSEQKTFSEDDLLSILLQTTESGENAVITNTDYLRQFGIEKDSIRVQELWQELFDVFKPALFDDHATDLKYILSKGTLATRLKNKIPEVNKKKLYNLFDEMTDCLSNNSFL
jgi:gamma-glutamyl:cysteine ligase YbdK (ATP-grasp superfamily)